MFDSFKDALQNVQQDLSASIKSLTSSDATISKKQVNISRCNSDAGCEILYRYQKNWSEIHHNTEENARRAESVNQLVSTVFEKCQQQKMSIRAMNNEVTSLPGLLENINKMSAQIGSLQGLVEEVESSLVHLEDIIETLEQQDLELNHRLQLASYKEKKRTDLEHTKAQLAARHAARLSHQEKREKELQKERALTFDEAFKEELQLYKEQGTLSKPVTVNLTMPIVKLDEIEIDTGDQEQYDRFLEDESPRSEFGNSQLSMARLTSPDSEQGGSIDSRMSQDTADITESDAE